MQKILMICHVFPPVFGGATIQSLRLGRALQLRGHKVGFLADNDDRGDGNEEYGGFDLYRRGTWNKNQNSIIKKIIWALRVLMFALSDKKFNIYHFHSVRGPELLLIPALQMLGKKVVIKLTLAESDDPLTFRNRRFLGVPYSWCQKRANMMVAISPSLVERATQAGVKSSKVMLIANGVDVSCYRTCNTHEKNILRSELNFDSNDKIVVSVGSVEYRKGYDLLLRSFKLLKIKIPEAKLIIVGPGNDLSNIYYKDLIKYINSEGLDGVTFLGRRDDIHRILRASDLFAFCSRQEGFGTALIEAMACGLAVAAMDIKGITGWILDGRPATRNCLSRLPEDFSDECQKLIYMHDEEVALEQSTSAAADFSIEAIVLRYEEMYSRL